MNAGSPSPAEKSSAPAPVESINCATAGVQHVRPFVHAVSWGLSVICSSRKHQHLTEIPLVCLPT